MHDSLVAICRRMPWLAEANLLRRWLELQSKPPGVTAICGTYNTETGVFTPEYIGEAGD